MSDPLVTFLADRSGLDADGERALLAAVRDPEQARRLTEQLIVDDLLSRAFSPDRSDFANRVFQRTAMLHSGRHFVRRLQTAVEDTQRPDRRRASRPARATSSRRDRHGSPQMWTLAPMALAALLAIGIGLMLFRGADHSAPAPAPTVAAQPLAPRSGPTRPAAPPSQTTAHLGAAATLIRDGTPRAAPGGTPLRLGDTVRTDAETSIELGDGSRFALSGSTTASIADLAQGFTLGLDHGTVRAEVAHQAQGSAVVIVTTQARVRVVGTRFSLATIDGLTTLDLEEGRVLFTNLVTGAETSAVAGDHVEAGTRRLAPAPAPPPAPAPEPPPAQKPRSLLLSTCDDTAGWISGAGSPRSRVTLKVEPGHDADSVGILVEAGAGDAPSCTIPCTRTDWRGYDGIRFWVKGLGTGFRYRFEIVQRHGLADEDERFQIELVDDSTQWKLMTLPFSSFARRVDQPAPRARPDALALDSEYAVSFMFLASGDLQVDTVEVYGK